jgi:ubiquitin carboxyl-terminal hydrolase 5/13
MGVKLGTIPPEGTAGKPEALPDSARLTIDVYCYICDDAKLDPDLAVHLGAFGIEVLGQTKTEKSMTELVSDSAL